MNVPNRNRIIYKVVLTGGPCGGKTTGQDRLATFFENLGWKVFRIPETFTMLANGGVKFTELGEEQIFIFQEDLLLAMLKIEQVFINQSELVTTHNNVLLIFDRGTMDPSAYMDPQIWQKILQKNSLNMIDIRDNRYNQIVHMVTAADGAEKFYSLANNMARREGLDDAISVDKITRGAWVGHPYVDIVDNHDCRSFDDKILKLLQVVCDRAGVEYHDRLARNSRKRKWLIRDFDQSKFLTFEEFDVVHDYIRCNDDDVQIRIRKRGQGGHWSYTLTTRRNVKGEIVETRVLMSTREYDRYRRLKDPRRATLYKRRRCFHHSDQYFHLDVYVAPLPPCTPNGRLLLLETYTTANVDDHDRPVLPTFVTVDREVTNDPQYSMFNLASLNDLQQ